MIRSFQSLVFSRFGFTGVASDISIEVSRLRRINGSNSRQTFRSSPPRDATSSQANHAVKSSISPASQS